MRTRREKKNEADEYEDRVGVVKVGEQREGKEREL